MLVALQTIIDSCCLGVYVSVKIEVIKVSYYRNLYSIIPTLKT